MKIFSGVRPTGQIHIGNYLGSIKQWIDLQEKEECVFCIVDWHAITTPYSPKELPQSVKNLAITYLTAGINPEKSVFFVQSSVKEHTELAWLLGSITSLGELKRMTQFKDKSKSHPEYINAGLLNYPVLMAADILLYQADVVPVGKDQKQHIEFTRNLAQKFNKTFGETFVVPKPFIPKVGAKIMSLQEPLKKMSKTDPKGCIDLFDSQNDIKKKVMSALTDTESEIKYDPKRKPGVSNLLTIYSLFSNEPIKSLEKRFADKGYGDFKKSLAEILIKELKPFRDKKDELSQRDVYVEEILKSGTAKAKSMAQLTMQNVRRNMGLD